MRSYPMTAKIKITQYVAEQLGLSGDEKSINNLKQILWQNPRNKEKGGLRLTNQGFENLKQAGIKYHKVVFEKPVEYTNQTILWLDNFIECPWFTTKREIFVFDDKIAVQLVLFSGNIGRFVEVRAKKSQISLT